MSGQRMIIGLALMGMMVLMLGGCGAKVSKSNYDKIKDGMTVSEVESILGKGTEQAGVAGTLGKLTGSGKIMVWKDGDKTITVTFKDDKVAAKVATGL